MLVVPAHFLTYTKEQIILEEIDSTRERERDWKRPSLLYLEYNKYAKYSSSKIKKWFSQVFKISRSIFNRRKKLIHRFSPVYNAMQEMLMILFLRHTNTLSRYYLFMTILFYICVKCPHVRESFPAICTCCVWRCHQKMEGRPNSKYTNLVVDYYYYVFFLFSLRMLCRAALLHHCDDVDCACERARACRQFFLSPSRLLATACQSLELKGETKEGMTDRQTNRERENLLYILTKYYIPKQK